MKYFAVINAEGFATAFYVETERNDIVPPEAFEITEEQWQRWIAAQRAVRWDVGLHDLVDVEDPWDFKKNYESRNQTNS